MLINILWNCVSLLTGALVVVAFVHPALVEGRGAIEREQARQDSESNYLSQRPGGQARRPVLSDESHDSIKATL